jgi:pyrimidine operon attenuation protein / uracil phosphoribosyltransferase
MDERIILNSEQLNLTLMRMAHQLIDTHGDFSNSILVGLQPRGVFFMARIQKVLESLINKEIQVGALDITFYRDDFRRTDKPTIPSVTNIDFSIEKKRIILVDDVLYTGRSVRSGLDALMAFGRPDQVELMALIDRRFQRHLPIQADYIGKEVESLRTERVKVEWSDTEGEDKVLLYTEENNG